MKAALIRLGIRGFNPKLKRAVGLVAIPTLKDEDAKRPSRERESLVGATPPHSRRE